MLFLVFTAVFLPSLAFAWDKINISINHPINTAYFVGIPEINIDAEEFTTVVLKIKSHKSGTARLFWATNFDPQLNDPKSIWFFIDKSSSFKEYVFNLRTQNPNWAGFIRQILVYPENGPDGIEIDTSAAFAGNLLFNLFSGWREFWGPRGRLVIGSTINTIQSSNLFGRSIFVYLYWLIGLFAAGHFSYQSYILSKEKKKKSPFSTAWRESGKSTLLAVIFFWLLLEISSLFNNFLSFQSDWKYMGKSYRDKLVQANTGDFYPFIEFCQQNIPSQAKFDMRIPPIYNDIKARYYLSPRQTSTTEAEYLVVFDMAVEPTAAILYAPYKKFRDKAFILKKR